MKKIALALALAVALGGCAQLQQVTDGVKVVSTNIANPVTKDKLDEAEAGLQLVITGLRAYKTSCIQKIADKNCRANIKAIQVYTRQLPPMLKNVRGFVDQNDQVNAIKIYNSIVDLIADMKLAAQSSGIQVGGT